MKCKRKVKRLNMGVYVCVHIYMHAWVSLVAQLVKNPPAMQETPV